MTVWDDQFQAHGVFETLEQAEQALAASEEHLADAAQTEAHTRLRHVLDYTRDVLKMVDPELVSRPALDSIASQWTSAVSSLQQFASAPQQAYLDQANTQVDSALAQIPALLPVRTAADVEGIQEAIATFRRSIGQHGRHADSEFAAIDAKAQELDSRLTGQEQKVDAQDTRIDSVISEFQSQFSTEQSTRQTQFSTALEKAREDASDAVEELKTGFEEAATNAEKASTAAITDAQAKAEKELTDLRAEVAKRLDELNELREKAEQAVGATGSAVLAGGYQKAAKAEAKQANVWRVIAALAFVGATGVAIFAVAHGISAGFDVEKFGAKITIGLPIIALAYYAAHESTKHREQAQLNRQLELQLSSLDAYLRELPEPKRQEIKGELATRFFESGTRGVAAAERRASGRRGQVAPADDEPE